MKINIPHTAKISFLLIWLFAMGANMAISQSCIGEQGKMQWLLYENIVHWDIRSVFTSPQYPRNPDWVEPLGSLATPTNYNNNYGSLIRGFIKAPETGNYQFNLTGDDRTLFYLSTDTLPNNLVQLAEVPGWTGTSEHTKYPEQTSALVNLVEGQYYYFEARHKEGSGGDFVRVHWKTPSTLASPNWVVVPGQALYEYLCDPLCPKAGTPCNDGNPDTVNDRHDGNCHCLGTPATLPFPCIGERGTVQALYYDNISGSFVTSMYNAPHYPLSPNRAEILNRLQGPHVQANLYGTRIRGYLQPPVSGNYIFNVTGDNEVRLRLGPNETTAPADEIAFNNGYSGAFDHYTAPSQTSDTLFLQCGAFYSFELVHKESTGGDYYYVYWKTPFAVDTFWHVIDGVYLYRYGCESACIPAGTPCNDGDANTFNDMYDGNCNCTGTPCSDPSCTNALGYTPLEPCEAVTERHSTNPNSSWLSCEPAPSPNAKRPPGHWIQYDFGAIYALDNAHVWNYNAANAAGQGFKDVVIDYSLNGTDWSELGTFTWSQASGTPAYTGFDFSALSGISARYLLITALDNFDGSGCAGISEIVFNALTCPDAGQPCDDGNPQTTNDTYNEHCYCIGELDKTNDCDVVDLIKNEVPVTTGKYTAEMTITSSGLVKVGSVVHYIAGESITLLPGFEVEYGSEFLADIAPCAPSPALKGLKRLFKNKKKKKGGDGGGGVS